MFQHHTPAGPQVLHQGEKEGASPGAVQVQSPERPGPELREHGKGAAILPQGFGGAFSVRKVHAEEHKPSGLQEGNQGFPKRQELQIRDRGAHHQGQHGNAGEKRRQKGQVHRDAVLPEKELVVPPDDPEGVQRRHRLDVGGDKSPGGLPGSAAEGQRSPPGSPVVRSEEENPAGRRPAPPERCIEPHQEFPRPIVVRRHAPPDPPLGHRKNGTCGGIEPSLHAPGQRRADQGEGPGTAAQNPRQRQRRPPTPPHFSGTRVHWGRSRSNAAASSS